MPTPPGQGPLGRPSNSMRGLAHTLLAALLTVLLAAAAALDLLEQRGAPFGDDRRSEIEAGAAEAVVEAVDGLLGG